ncbi:hypothetical protein IZ6_29480 [Terrihabitans soli]|uniref:Uncharacterized protein n=1 Tax=Terrihabitans soli TaxID=708113 RepID=A0A6S6QLJ6_9HYPH|nr:hypothetical protein IZ6_29480 [Terrihabitans soli]
MRSVCAEASAKPDPLRRFAFKWLILKYYFWKSEVWRDCRVPGFFVLLAARAADRIFPAG